MQRQRDKAFSEFSDTMWFYFMKESSIRWKTVQTDTRQEVRMHVMYSSQNSLVLLSFPKGTTLTVFITVHCYSKKYKHLPSIHCVS